MLLDNPSGGTPTNKAIIQACFLFAVCLKTKYNPFFTLRLSSNRFNVAMCIIIMACYSYKFACFWSFLALFGCFHHKKKTSKTPSKVISILDSFVIRSGVENQTNGEFQA